MERQISTAVLASLVLVFGVVDDLAAQRRAPATQRYQQVAEIDRQIAEVWKEYDLRPSEPATDGEWCRRVHLDLIGRIPTVEELEAFLSSKSRSKREDLVNSLLYDEKYTEEYARNWTTIWTNLLIGRAGGNDNNSMISREGMQKYLRDAFARDIPYDRFVRELVAASGSTQPGSESFNGAVNFLVDKVNEDNASQATAAVSKIFLGLQVQCTQCHNHPFNDWRQQKYWEMNAFFRQVRAEREGDRQAGAGSRLFDRDFAGEGAGGDIAEAVLFYEERNGYSRTAFPVFVDGTPIPRDGRVAQVNRREALADLIVGSNYLEKAAVNRLWAHFLGYGFTKPVDDLGPHNVPSHPELLDYLASEFRKSSFGMKQLMTWIVLSRPYALSSKITSDNAEDDPSLGVSPKFSHFYLRQMQAEQLYESLVVATRASEERGSYEEQERQKNMWLQQFVSAFGTDDGAESTSFDGTIPQILMMFNGDLIRQATSDRPGSFLDRIASGPLPGPKKIDYLYLAALSRTPTKDERAIAQAFLEMHAQNPKAALSDVWWLVLNSSEFIFNH
ncbi:MAG TPA: hypothetical protein DCQ98_20770 [Planctomycetaceae bacterium]|nr:hypothetical protein [Planctomycetaceae bacterium]HRE99045.1 DUF1549 and DUF1553 domain-containing protein [Pirellulaceae bacterium]